MDSVSICSFKGKKEKPLACFVPGDTVELLEEPQDSVPPLLRPLVVFQFLLVADAEEVLHEVVHTEPAHK